MLGPTDSTAAGGTRGHGPTPLWNMARLVPVEHKLWTTGAPAGRGAGHGGEADTAGVADDPARARRRVFTAARSRTDGGPAGSGLVPVEHKLGDDPGGSEHGDGHRPWRGAGG